MGSLWRPVDVGFRAGTAGIIAPVGMWGPGGSLLGSWNKSKDFPMCLFLGEENVGESPRSACCHSVLEDQAWRTSMGLDLEYPEG